MKYLTPKQVSEMLGWGYTTVLKRANDGDLPARKFVHGRKAKYLFVEEEVIAAIESRKIRKLA